MLVDGPDCATRGTCDAFDLLASKSDEVRNLKCVCDRLKVVFEIVHASFGFALAALEKHLAVDLRDEKELPNKLVGPKCGVREQSTEEIIQPYLCIAQ
jgi:hypothetical protein